MVSPLTQKLKQKRKKVRREEKSNYDAQLSTSLKLGTRNVFEYFTFHFHALEKEMASHTSVLAWRIPETREPGRLLSMGSHRVGHDWSDLAAAAFFMVFIIEW